MQARNFRNADENEELEIVHEKESDIDNVDEAMDEDDIREEPFKSDDKYYEDRLCFSGAGPASAQPPSPAGALCWSKADSSPWSSLEGRRWSQS